MKNSITIISHSSMYSYQGKSYIFGPTAREIDYISSEFDKVYWLGFNGIKEKGSRIFDEISNDKIEIIPISPMGGKGLWKKIDIVIKFPIVAFQILKLINKSEVIHTRSPSSPAFIACLSSFFFKNKIWWNKYAGNWMQENPPFFYGVQKKLLLKLKHTFVSINGHWPNQPKHCLSFENPCLYDKNLEIGKDISFHKNFKEKLEFVFIGRLEEEKGVQRILDLLKNNDINKIKCVHFIGDGPNREKFESQKREITFPIYFHGYLSNHDVHEILKKSHFLLLPSTASEGFPKVIAEASCYGCIPIVSDVSSITHYVKNNINGFIWNVNGEFTYDNIVLKAINSEQQALHNIAVKCYEMSIQFGFSAFLEKLNKKILVN